MFFRNFIIWCCIVSAASLPAQWPDNLNALKKSLCLVEFYQPQSETKNIRDDERIKRKITGILVSGNGLVMTSDLIFPAGLDIVSSGGSLPNVQKPPQDITVSFNRDKKFKAHFIGKDEEFRLAFIQIADSGGFPVPVTFKGDEKFKMGDPLYIIQHLDGRYDNELFVSGGFINAVMEGSPQKLLSDIPLHPLSPGGLAVNRKGEAIGVVFRSDPFRSSDFFGEIEISPEKEITEILPSAYFVKLIKNPPQLKIQKEGGGKSWLGIQMQILTRDMAAYWGLKDVHGIIVSSVVPRSPAEKAKLQQGDIITSIGTFQIKTDDEKIIEEFRNYIRSLPEGEIPLQVIRDHHALALPVNLESAPKSQFFADDFFDETLGLRVQELTQDLIMNYDLDFDAEGVWVSRVEEAGPASLAGLEVNDLILSIDDSQIKNLDGFREIITRLEQQRVNYIQVFVRRDMITQYIFIKTGFGAQ